MVIGFSGSLVQTGFFLLAIKLMGNPEKGMVLYYVAFAIALGDGTELCVHQLVHVRHPTDAEERRRFPLGSSHQSAHPVFPSAASRLSAAHVAGRFPEYVCHLHCRMYQLPRMSDLF